MHGLGKMLPLFALTLSFLCHSTSQVFARGPNYRWIWQQQQKWFTQQVQAMQKQQEAEYKAFLDRFDTNHNGRIDGKERGPAERYLRKLRGARIPMRIPETSINGLRA